MIRDKRVETNRLPAKQRRITWTFPHKFFLCFRNAISSKKNLQCTTNYWSNTLTHICNSLLFLFLSLFYKNSVSILITSGMHCGGSRNCMGFNNTALCFKKHHNLDALRPLTTHLFIVAWSDTFFKNNIVGFGGIYFSTNDMIIATWAYFWKARQ